MTKLISYIFADFLCEHSTVLTDEYEDAKECITPSKMNVNPVLELPASTDGNSEEKGAEVMQT
jgi:hypothetical protein